jgi:hypothetical protein
MLSLWQFEVDEKYKTGRGDIILIKHVENVDNFDHRQYVWFEQMGRQDKKYLSIFLSDSEFGWGLEKVK